MTPGLEAFPAGGDSRTATKCVPRAKNATNAAAAAALPFFDHAGFAPDRVDPYLAGAAGVARPTLFPLPQGDALMPATAYIPPRVWTWDKESGGAFANLNRPVARPTPDRELPVAIGRASGRERGWQYG